MIHSMRFLGSDECDRAEFSTEKTRFYKSLPVDIDLEPQQFTFLNRPPEVLQISELLALGSGEVETQLFPRATTRSRPGIGSRNLLRPWP